MGEFTSGKRPRRWTTLLLYAALVVCGFIWAQINMHTVEDAHIDGHRGDRIHVVTHLDSAILDQPVSPSPPAPPSPPIRWQESGVVEENGMIKSYVFPRPPPLTRAVRSSTDVMYNDRRLMQHYMLTMMRQMMTHARNSFGNGKSVAHGNVDADTLWFYFEVFDAGKPIDRLHRPDPMFLFRNYVQQGRPAIITGVVDQWDAYRLWSDEYFVKTIGHKEVNIEVSKTLRFTGDSKRVRMGKFTVAEFLKRYRAADSNERYYLAETSFQEVFPELQKDFPKVPSVIAPDMYRFDVSQLWIGPGGQITPMHSDDQENLLCQLDGSRKVILFDPYQADLLYLNPENEVYTDFDPDTQDFDRYPLAQFARPIVAELRKGEMLFMPSYWYHLVKSQPGRSLAINYWYAPFSSVQGLTRLTLISTQWRDPNDPNAKFVMNRKRS